ncbi:uncharacterized protein BX663DRAFT_491744 [Cokeromyces recurvatus]|uniref:uncharacterized protein n=1 Tax=Cokeromyces recurvatus TaxID=90255 RepID=UPI00221E8EAA|nr:uncharacterized protein BX663DRAFT_491744 [Cokeromyces recurvatus]KAI7907693.1 hypothetical protein BX663DRAFT_491744 [Cokeromyces recurvatus]
MSIIYLEIRIYHLSINKSMYSNIHIFTCIQVCIYITVELILYVLICKLNVC